jgi:dihydroorotase
MTSPASVLLKGGLVIDPASGKCEVSDLRVSDQFIAAVGTNLQAHDGEEVVDASNLWVCPGFIDLHTHLRDLGQKDREDIDTGTRAAAAGGFTTVVAMANTDPPLDNTATLQVVLKRIADHAHIEVLPVACVTKGLQGAELTNMVDLAEAGAIAFSDDGMCISNMAVLRRALEYTRLAERVIISHAEDKDLAAGGVIHEGITATRLGLPGIPVTSETVAVAREIEMVRQFGSPYHFTHVSCADSVKLIRQAKEDGLPITADVTPHHLTLTVDEIEPYDTGYKMKPPLRTARDTEALLAGLKDGTIDAIATDHAPHTRLEKAGSMAEANVGIIGLESALPLTLECLVTKGRMPPLQFVALITTRAAAVLDLPQPSLTKDSPANIAVIDPALKWTYDTASGFSKSKNTPFQGRIFTGKALMTIYAGKAVYKDESALASRAALSSS